MLKRKIDKSAYDALPDVLKAEYKSNGDNYVLDTDDARDLITARDKEKERADALKTELDRTKTTLKDLETANGDFTVLKSSYETKIAALEADKATLNTTITNERRDRWVGDAAKKIASKFTVPTLVEPLIAARLDVDPRDGKTIRVKDKEGKPSVATLEDLTKEFVDNPEYKSIVVASKSSGSAEPGKPFSGSAGNPPPSQAAADLSKMAPSDLVAHLQAKKAAETT